LALASEQEAHGFRGYLTAAVEESNCFRIEQRAEIEASKKFRSQQRHALQQTKARQIQKIVKEEGTSHATKVIPTRAKLTKNYHRTSKDPVAATCPEP
jgi:hypothetical protein